MTDFANADLGFDDTDVDGLVIDLDLSQLTSAADRAKLAGGAAGARAKRTRVVRPSSVILDRLTDIHAATTRPLPVAFDAVLLLIAATIAHVGNVWQTLGWTALLLTACYVGQVYSDRDSVETQGVLWYALLPTRSIVSIAFVAAIAHVLALNTAAQLAGWSLLMLFGARCVLWSILVVLRRRGYALRRTLIVGTDEVAAQLWRRLVEFPEAGLVPVQLLDWALVDRPEVLETEIERHQISHVVLVAPSSEALRFTGSLRGDHHSMVRLSVVPVLAEMFVNPGAMTTVASIPLVPLGRVMRRRSSYAGKALLDILIAGTALLATLPILIATAIAIKLDDGGPILFRQKRVGLDGLPFEMLKFRSMSVNAEQIRLDLLEQNASDGLLFKMHDDPRVTRVGTFIRRTSIDELPQLLNVVGRTMSLVGPRPLPVAPEEFDAWDNERHASLPGITGYWQISGGSALGYEEMVRLDLAYVRNSSLTLDLRLMARTIPALLHRHGPA